MTAENHSNDNDHKADAMKSFGLSQDEWDGLNDEDKATLLDALPSPSNSSFSTPLTKVILGGPDGIGFAVNDDSLSSSEDDVGWSWGDLSHVVLGPEGAYVVLKDDAAPGAYPYPPRDDAERARVHFKISTGDWDKLTDEEQKDWISKLPPRGSGSDKNDIPVLELDTNAGLPWSDLSHVIVGSKGAILTPKTADAEYPKPPADSDLSWKWDEISHILISAKGVKVVTIAEKEEYPYPSPYPKPEGDYNGSGAHPLRASIKTMPTDPAKLKAAIKAVPKKTSTRAMELINMTQAEWEKLSDKEKWSLLGKLPDTDQEETIHGKLAKEKAVAIKALMAKVLKLGEEKNITELNSALNQLESLCWDWKSDIRTLQALVVDADLTTAVTDAEKILGEHKRTIKMEKPAYADSAGRPTRVSFVDEAAEIKSTKVNDEGHLVMDTVLMKPMVQEYIMDDKTVHILKCPDEIKKAVAFVNGSYVTDDHPEERYVSSPDQVKGFLSDAKLTDEGAISCLTTVEDTALQAKISDGKKDVSAGFQASLDWTPGDFEDKHYDAIQRDILIDHEAIVEVGRCSTIDGCGLRAPVMVAVDRAPKAEDEIKQLTDQIQKLHEELKQPVVDSILGMTDRFPREDLMAKDAADLRTLLEVIKDSKPADTPSSAPSSQSYTNMVDKAYGCG